jgi:predicted Fe-Mo cluster-binding NifX family protein
LNDKNLKMKAAFACWDDRIAPVFDTTRQVHVIEAESGQIIGERQETLSEDLDFRKVLRLVEIGIDMLVCGAISRSLHGLVAAYGIQVIPFVAGDLGEIIQAWLQGELVREEYAMPGCRGRGRQRFRGMNTTYQEAYTMRGRGQATGAGGRSGKKGQGQGGQRPGGRSGAQAAGALGHCICPQCGQKEAHERGVPCIERKCPKCGTAMTRQ